MDFLSLCVTALSSFVALFIIAKFIGHKQIAQLDFFDYITGITIGSIAAEMATELEDPWKPLTAMAIYGGAAWLLGVLSNQFPRMRKYLNGTPYHSDGSRKALPGEFQKSQTGFKRIHGHVQAAGLLRPDRHPNGRL